MQKALQEVLFTLIFVPLSKESWFSKTYGVIGNTSDFGSDILGSSPSRSTEKKALRASGGPFFVMG